MAVWGQVFAVEIDMRKVSIAIFILLVVIAAVIVFYFIPLNQQAAVDVQEEEKPFSEKLNTLPELTAKKIPEEEASHIITLFIRDGRLANRGLAGHVETPFTVQVINQDDEVHMIQLNGGPGEEEWPLERIEPGNNHEIELSFAGWEIAIANILCRTCRDSTVATVWGLPEKEMLVAPVQYTSTEGFSADQVKVASSQLFVDTQNNVSYAGVMLLVWNRTDKDIRVSSTPNIVNASSEFGPNAIQEVTVPAGQEYPLMPVLREGVEFVYQCIENCPGEINEGRIVVR